MREKMLTKNGSSDSPPMNLQSTVEQKLYRWYQKRSQRRDREAFGVFRCNYYNSVNIRINEIQHKNKKTMIFGDDEYRFEISLVLIVFWPYAWKFPIDFRRFIFFKHNIRRHETKHT